jgi:hypothetical protein
MSRLTIWVLILGSCATATGQTGVPEGSLGLDGRAGLFLPVEQSEESNPPEASPYACRIQVNAKTVLVIYETPELHPTSKAEQSLKKALVKWGRFQLVDEAEAADLIIVISGYSSSKPTKTERIRENLAIFVGGSTANVDATPLWAVSEVGPALGQRPTAKLVEDFRKHLSELEKSVRESAASSRK